jgi:hypothetical protein
MADKSNGYVSVFLKRADSDTWETIALNNHNLLTNGGRDFIHNQAYTNVAAGTQGSRYIAVTTDSGAPAAGDTTLTGEISTNGLQRVAATTNTHSNGTNTSTLGITFTASGAHTSVQKSALFNASSTGTMTHEATFTAVTLATNDQLQVTWTLTLG